MNDMLALKEADCSIAIAEGSEAVKQLSQIVLLNSEFSCLPEVVLEGRRVVNNLTRVASVFFIKTIYSIILTIACAICNIPFPFIPIQITLIDFAIEAWPSFLTLLEPQTQKIKGQFLPTVLKNTFPHACGVLLCFLLVYTGRPLFHIPMEQSVTMMYLALACMSMQAVIVSSFPMTKLRLLVYKGFMLKHIIRQGMIFLFITLSKKQKETKNGQNHRRCPSQDCPPRKLLFSKGSFIASGFAISFFMIISFFLRPCLPLSLGRLLFFFLGDFFLFFLFFHLLSIPAR